MAQPDLKTFDLVVVGAGIYGVWTAWHASARGLKVALVDRGDIAGQTSSCSTKLLHGGLRYLENFEFSLVRKSLAERKELKTLMPHLFRPARFWVPVRRGRPAPAWKLGMGLWCYEHLASSRGVVPPSRREKRSKLRSTFPGLKADGLDAAFSYGDGITDDHRMALVVALGAQRMGCEVFTHHEAEVSEGPEVLIRSTQGAERSLITKNVIHCTGKDLSTHPQLKGKIKMTQGLHLVFPSMGMEEALLLSSGQDGRKFFVVPWYGRTLLGTTDLVVKAEPKAIEAEVQYLFDSVADHLDGPFSRDQLLGSFIGVRVMQGAEGLKPSQISREWTCTELGDGQWASVGGKYTSARVDASEMVDQVFGSGPSEKHIIEGCDGKGMSRDSHLNFRFGSRAQEVEERRVGEMAEALVPDLPFSWAEVAHSLEHEMVGDLVDLLRRRIPLTILHPFDEGIADRAAQMATSILGWDEKLRDHHRQELERRWRSCLSFSDGEPDR